MDATKPVLRHVPGYYVRGSEGFFGNARKSKFYADDDQNISAAGRSSWSRGEPHEHSLPLASATPPVPVEGSTARGNTRHAPLPVVPPTAAEAESGYRQISKGNAVPHPALALQCSLHVHRQTVSLRADNAPSTTTSQPSGMAAGPSGQEQSVSVDSDAESVDTTAAVVFAPVSKIKKSLEKRKALAMAAGQSSSTN